MQLEEIAAIREILLKEFGGMVQEVADLRSAVDYLRRDINALGVNLAHKFDDTKVSAVKVDETNRAMLAIRAQINYLIGRIQPGESDPKLVLKEPQAVVRGETGEVVLTSGTQSEETLKKVASQLGYSVPGYWFHNLLARWRRWRSAD